MLSATSYSDSIADSQSKVVASVVSDLGVFKVIAFGGSSSCGASVNTACLPCWCRDPLAERSLRLSAGVMFLTRSDGDILLNVILLPASS